MEKKKTNTKILSEEAKELLYSIDNYAKGDIKEYNTKVITLDCTAEDIKFSLDEGVVFRQFFNVENNEVTIPVFFTVVEGVYNDIGEYIDLFNTCKQCSNTLFIESIRDLLDEDLYKETGINKIKNVIGSVINIAEFKYSKFFIKGSNKFDVEKIINSRDKRFSKYPLDLQKFLFNKLNHYINFNKFNMKIEDGDKFKLLELISNMNYKVIELLNNFDISKSSPKVTLFLGENNTLDNVEILFLGYLHSLGMDIIIFTPSGLANIDLLLNSTVFSKLKLDKTHVGLKYQLIKDINKYLNKYRLKIEDLQGALSSLGYTQSLREYRKRLKIVKHPILYKISTYISGGALVAISMVGALVNLAFLIYSIITTSALIPVLATILGMLGLALIFGFILVSLEI